MQAGKEANNESAECKSHENPFAKGKSCLEIAELMYGAVKSGVSCSWPLCRWAEMLTEAHSGLLGLY